MRTARNADKHNSHHLYTITIYSVEAVKAYLYYHIVYA